jgi:HK97 family phage prohead protease
MNRAYSLIDITKSDDDARVIEGTATTPEVDREGDIVVSEGANYRLPLPLLMQHAHNQPVGNVEWVEVQRTGIRFRARFARITDAGRLKDRIDEAWQSVRAGLIRAVSIGFRPLKMEPIETGWRYVSWQWLELSVCVLPANESATIQNVKRLMKAPAPVVRLPGGPKKYAPVVKLSEDDVRAGRERVRAAALDVLNRRGADAATNVHELTANMIGAVARATDAELIAVRQRLDEMERRR